MIEKLIEKYIDRLTKQDIITFANNNNTFLSSNEVDVIYNTIKTYWKDIIFNDYNAILNGIKNKINPTTYIKMKELILLYKDKYKSYL